MITKLVDVVPVVGSSWWLFCFSSRITKRREEGEKFYEPVNKNPTPKPRRKRPRTGYVHLSTTMHIQSFGFFLGTDYFAAYMSVHFVRGMKQNLFGTISFWCV